MLAPTSAGRRGAPAAPPRRSRARDAAPPRGCLRRFPGALGPGLQPLGERAGKGCGRLALLRAQIGVAGADGEPIGSRARSGRPDLQAEVEVARHALEDGRLLRVLLPEVGTLGADDVEELQADGGDAAEVPRPHGALQLFSQVAHLDPGAEPVRVHLLDRRHEQVLDAPGLGEGGVLLLVARVALEVLARPELRRVDEDARHDDVALGACPAHERLCPSWGAPIVGMRPTDPTRRGPSAARSPAIVRWVVTRRRRSPRSR